MLMGRLMAMQPVEIENKLISNRTEDETTIEAYIFVSVLRDIPKVMRDIKENTATRKHIEEMCLVFGGADIIVRMKSPSVKILHEQVNAIQRLPEVSLTKTYIVDPSKFLNHKIEDSAEYNSEDTRGRRLWPSKKR
jgi:hypothetical protein